MVSIDHVAFAAIENAGIDDPGRALELRLFVEWDGPESIHPGRTRIDHPSGAHRIALARVRRRCGRPGSM